MSGGGHAAPAEGGHKEEAETKKPATPNEGHKKSAWNSVGKFFLDRIASPVGHVGGIVNSVATGVARVFGTKRSLTAPGFIGGLFEAGRSIKNTFVGERGIFHGNTDKPFSEEGVLNPMEIGRKLVVGAVETNANLLGGLTSWAFGDTAKNMARSIGYAATSVIVGDTKRLRTISKINDSQNATKLYSRDINLFRRNTNDAVLDAVEAEIAPPKSEPNNIGNVVSLDAHRKAKHGHAVHGPKHAAPAAGHDEEHAKAA